VPARDVTMTSRLEFPALPLTPRPWPYLLTFSDMSDNCVFVWISARSPGQGLGVNGSAGNSSRDVIVTSRAGT